MNAHAREAIAAANAMADTYGRHPDDAPIGEGMAVVTKDGTGWVEWIDADRVTVCVERRAWITYPRAEVRSVGKCVAPELTKPPRPTGDAAEALRAEFVLALAEARKRAAR